MDCSWMSKKVRNTKSDWSQILKEFLFGQADRAPGDKCQGDAYKVQHFTLEVPFACDFPWSIPYFLPAHIQYDEANRSQNGWF